LLGAVELEDSLTEKRHRRQLNEILTHNSIFGNRVSTGFRQAQPPAQQPTKSMTYQNTK
jgi:hypothetical protein